MQIVSKRDSALWLTLLGKPVPCPWVWRKEGRAAGFVFVLRRGSQEEKTSLSPCKPVLTLVVPSATTRGQSRHFPAPALPEVGGGSSLGESWSWWGSSSRERAPGQLCLHPAGQPVLLDSLASPP